MAEARATTEGLDDAKKAAASMVRKVKEAAPQSVVDLEAGQVQNPEKSITVRGGAHSEL